jgi:hypothetical protein
LALIYSARGANPNFASTWSTRGARSASSGTARDLGVLQRLHVEGDAEQEATGSEGAEGEGVGVVEAQVNGVGHGASGCWKRSGTVGIIGLQRSVQEWAIRQGWGGRPVRHEQAQGILVAALGVLAAHLGHGAAKRAS